MGILIGSESVNISLLKNFFSSSAYRNPRVGGKNVEIINNFIYNYNADGTDIFGSARDAFVNVIGNYYKEGPNSVRTRAPILITNRQDNIVFLEGNLSEHWRPNLSLPASRLVRGSPGRFATEPQFVPSSYRLIEDLDDLPAWMEAQVGAQIRGQKDEIDQRIFRDSFAGRGRRIDSPREVGGYPTYPAGRAPLDSDNDGVPDEFEDEIGSNRNRPDSSEDEDGDGYTNIEEYINSLL